MNLKSLVNRGIVKSDLRRYWWLGVTFALMLFVITVLPLRTFMIHRPDESIDFIHSAFASMAHLSLLAIVPFCIITPALLYSYLHHKTAVCEVHRLPLSRTCLYFSHLVSACVLLALPIIINAGLMFTMVNIQPSYILLWAALSLVYAFVITGFSAAASMLVGNTAAGMVLPFIVMLLPLFLAAMIEFLSVSYLRGYSGNIFPYVSWIYPGYTGLLNGGMYLYLGLGIVFIALGCLFYRMRRLENHTRILAFDVLNPVFMYGLAFCAGLTGYAYVSTILYNGRASMWIGLPFGIIGVIIARMIISKTFKPRKIIKPIIVYVMMMCVLYMFFGADITGFEKRVPDINNVESVNVIYENYGIRYTTNMNGERTYLADSAKHDSTLYDKEDIEKVIALHQAIVENSEPSNDDALYSVPITYKLKNGRIMKRQYRVARNSEVFPLYCAVSELKPIKGERFPIISDAEVEYTGVTVVNLGMRTQLDETRQKQMLDALKEDVLAASYIDTEYGNTLTRITVDERMPSLDEDMQPIEDKSRWCVDVLDYNIYPSYTNCISLLKEWGLYNIMPDADSIEEITVWEYTDRNSKCARVTDKEEIGKILIYLKENENTMNNPEYMEGDTQRFEIHYNALGGSYYSVDAPKMEGIIAE